MKLSDYTGKPCRSKMAYEFLPRKTTKVDLECACEEMDGKATVEVKSKILLILKFNEHTVSLFPSGKILVRGEKDEEKARKTAEGVILLLKKSIL